MDSLPPKELAYQKAHFNDNLSDTIIGVCTLFSALALLSVIARMAARHVSKSCLGLDDYLALAAAFKIPIIGLNVSACLVGHWGIGRVLIRVAQQPENFVHIGKTELAFSVFYDWSMALGKLSILALLARVFTLHHMWFKISIYFWTTWTILWWIAGWFIIFLECRPLSTNWGSPTQCRPAFRTSIAAAVFNTVSDIGILILPQRVIWNLQLPNNKKYALSLLFLLGFFASAVSIARIPLLKGADSISNYNSTYTSAVPVMFTVIEPTTVLICACLPMIFSLLRRVPAPKLSSYLFGSFNHPSRNAIAAVGGGRSSAECLGQRSSDEDTSHGSRHWNKLDESSASSTQMPGKLSYDKVEYELMTPEMSTKPKGRETGLPKVARDLV